MENVIAIVKRVDTMLLKELEPQWLLANKNKNSAYVFLFLLITIAKIKNINLSFTNLRQFLLILDQRLIIRKELSGCLWN